MKLSLGLKRVYDVAEAYDDMLLSVPEIADELGFTEDHCSRTAKALVDLGVFERVWLSEIKNYGPTPFGYRVKRGAS